MAMGFQGGALGAVDSPPEEWGRSFFCTASAVCHTSCKEQNCARNTEYINQLMQELVPDLTLYKGYQLVILNKL